MVENLPSVALPVEQSDAREQIVPLGSLAYLRPTYLAMSAWTEHIPFAFWLIEAMTPSVFVELGTHYGVSYFAFCQALEKLDLGAQAFAVDLWTGDEHSGLYGPEVFDAVRQHNDRAYSHFSTLKKGSFDEARDYFLDGSIDLLHIDGLHTYDAVKDDFETWLPKMSPRGVVVFHDTNVRERNFGVFRLFAELREIYPTFEFNHGHGLGIVGVGTNQTERMRHLFDAGERHDDRRDIQKLFSTLGRGCYDAYKVQKNDQILAEVRHKLQAESAKYQETAKQAEQRVAALVADLEERTKLSQAATSARDQLDVRVQRLENELEVRDGDARRAEEHHAKRIRELEEARAALEQVRASEREKHVETLRDEKARSEARIKELFVEIATLTRLLKDAEAMDFEATASLELGRAILKAIKLPKVWNILPAAQRLKRQKTLLRRSGLFDPEWYVTEYRDVAEAGVDPVRHYIEYGALEGRRPKDLRSKSREVAK